MVDYMKIAFEAQGKTFVLSIEHSPKVKVNAKVVEVVFSTTGVTTVRLFNDTFANLFGTDEVEVRPARDTNTYSIPCDKVLGLIMQ